MEIRESPPLIEQLSEGKEPRKLNKEETYLLVDRRRIPEGGIASFTLGGHYQDEKGSPRNGHNILLKFREDGISLSCSDLPIDQENRTVSLPSDAKEVIIGRGFGLGVSLKPAGTEGVYVYEIGEEIIPVGGESDYLDISGLKLLEGTEVVLKGHTRLFVSEMAVYLQDDRSTHGTWIEESRGSKAFSLEKSRVLKNRKEWSLDRMDYDPYKNTLWTEVMIDSDEPVLEIDEYDDVCAWSERGQRYEKEGEGNEDHIGVLFVRNKKGELIRLVVVVSDGVGGKQAGEIASEITVGEVLDGYAEKLKQNSEIKSGEAVKHGLQRADSNIRNQVNQKEEWEGIRSTAVVVELTQTTRGCLMQEWHCGNSGVEIYQREEGRMRMVFRTADDTVAAREVREGKIKAEDAKTHPERHILTRSIGSGLMKEEPPTHNTRFLEPGDILLVVSDGVSEEYVSVVPLEEREDILENAADISEAVVSLATAADTTYGGPDNIAVVGVQC